jgi:hypothetical protein
MKNNNALNLYSQIGGTAYTQAHFAHYGLQDETVKRKPKNNPAGSKLQRQLDRDTRGLTCKHGNI